MKRWRVVYGGSFNPLHAGHVAVVEGLLALDGTAEVLVVPARISALKTGQRMLPASLRLEILRAVFAGVARVRLWDGELHRPPPSYTLDTLVQLRAEAQAPPLALALGWDAFVTLPAWYQAEEVLRLAALWAIPRQGGLPPAPSSGAADWLRSAGAPLQSLLSRAARQQALPPALVAALLAGRPPPQGLERRLWLAPVQAPPISATQVLATRDATLLPPQARPLLQAYWQTHPR